MIPKTVIWIGIGVWLALTIAPWINMAVVDFEARGIYGPFVFVSTLVFFQNLALIVAVGLLLVWINWRRDLSRLLRWVALLPIIISGAFNVLIWAPI